MKERYCVKKKKVLNLAADAFASAVKLPVDSGEPDMSIIYEDKGIDCNRKLKFHLVDVHNEADTLRMQMSGL